VRSFGSSVVHEDGGELQAGFGIGSIATDDDPPPRRQSAAQSGKNQSVVPFRGKRDWASKAIVDLDGNPITEDLLNEIGVEHSKPIRATKIELSIYDPPGGRPSPPSWIGEEWPADPKVEIDGDP
jgi:hypothetical protein